MTGCSSSSVYEVLFEGSGLGGLQPLQHVAGLVLVALLAIGVLRFENHEQFQQLVFDISQHGHQFIDALGQEILKRQGGEDFDQPLLVVVQQLSHSLQVVQKRPADAGVAQAGEDAVQGCQQAAVIVLNGLGLPHHVVGGLLAHFGEVRQVCCRLGELVRCRLDRLLQVLKAVHRLFDITGQVAQFFIPFPILIAHRSLHVGLGRAVADGLALRLTGRSCSSCLAGSRP